MARPAKPVTVLKAEQKTHKTKRELASRSREERAMLTGTAMVEDPDTAADPVAHEKFMETVELFEALEKADRVYSDIVNRYAQLYSIWRTQKRNYAETGDGYNDMMKTHDAMFKIERENCMTMASALRAIPKKPEKATNPLLEVLNA